MDDWINYYSGTMSKLINQVVARKKDQWNVLSFKKI